MKDLYTRRDYLNAEIARYEGTGDLNHAHRLVQLRGQLESVEQQIHEAETAVAEENAKNVAAQHNQLVRQALEQLDEVRATVKKAADLRASIYRGNDRFEHLIQPFGVAGIMPDGTYHAMESYVREAIANHGFPSDHPLAKGVL